jgi:hypothetical protein
MVVDLLIQIVQPLIQFPFGGLGLPNFLPGLIAFGYDFPRFLLGLVGNQPAPHREPRE